MLPNEAEKALRAREPGHSRSLLSVLDTGQVTDGLAEVPEVPEPLAVAEVELELLQARQAAEGARKVLRVVDSNMLVFFSPPSIFTTFPSQVLQSFSTFFSTYSDLVTMLGISITLIEIPEKSSAKSDKIPRHFQRKTASS